MGCPKLAYYPTPDLNIVSSEKELTPKNTVQKERSNNLYRYNGKEKDEETGLYNYGQRYYAPCLCRFFGVDPVAEKFADLSSYNYAGNKPVTKVDQEGLQEENRQETPKGSSNQAQTDQGNKDAGSMKIEVHQVKEGETISGLAKEYGVSQDAIREANPQTQERGQDDQINAGENLVVPLDNSKANTELNINDVESNPSVHTPKEQESEKNDPFNSPINLDESQTPGSDLINRTKKVLETGGEISDIVKPGTSIDEGFIDIFEAFGNNYFQRDEAYGGKYKGSDVLVTTFGEPDDQTIHHIEPHLIRAKNEKYSYALRLRNVNNEELLEFRFKSYDEYKKVYDEFARYHSNKK